MTEDQIMEKEEIENYKKAGQIARDALNYGKTLIKEGASALNIQKEVENKILELGGQIAFPTQLSFNDTAAHFCAEKNNDVIIKDQLIKLDVGAHVNGFIGDNALSVDMTKNNEFQDIIKASREALDNAIKIINPNTELKSIGKTIQDTIESYNLSPIKNLSGHGLGKFNIHSSPTIPNFDTGEETKLNKPLAFAVEPFATNGAGLIYETGSASVFTLTGIKPVRDTFTKNILNEIKTYGGLPFATHWLQEKFSDAQINFALRNLDKLEILKFHPPLIDRKHGMVAQSEHTILIDNEGKTIITTK